MLKRAFFAAAIVAGSALAATPAHADDWGCEVLLCSMSANPAWQGVPSCIAPMTRLLNAMNGWFFSWPICVGANATRPVRSSYPPCPPGQESIALSDLSPGCYDTGSQTASKLAQRAQPWNFDTRNADGTTTRHWFSLSR